MDSVRFESAWRQMEAELERMATVAHAHGAAFVVVAIPQAGAADPYMEMRLRRWSAAHEALFIPTSDAIRAAAAADPRPLYWKRDGHCTAAGYRVIADTIVAALLAHGAVP